MEIGKLPKDKYLILENLAEWKSAKGLKQKTRKVSIVERTRLGEGERAGILYVERFLEDLERDRSGSDRESDVSADATNYIINGLRISPRTQQLKAQAMTEENLFRQGYYRPRYGRIKAVTASRS